MTVPRAALAPLHATGTVLKKRYHCERLLTDSAENLHSAGKEHWEKHQDSHHPTPPLIYILWPCLVRSLLRNYNNWELIMLGHQKNQSVTFTKTHLWTFSLKMRNSEWSVITSVNQSLWDEQTSYYTNSQYISLIMAFGWNTLFSLAVFGHILCVFLLSFLATTTLSLFSSSPGVWCFIHFMCTTSLQAFCRQWIMTELIYTNWLA